MTNVMAVRPTKVRRSVKRTPENVRRKASGAELAQGDLGLISITHVEVAQRRQVVEQSKVFFGIEAIAMAVDQRHGFIKIIDPDNAQHRPKNLLLVTSHAGLHLVDERATNKESSIFICYLRRPAINYDRRTIGFRTCDQVDDPVPVLRRNQRPKIIGGILGTTDLEFCHLVFQFPN